MSADRYEILDEGSQIRILYSGSISTIISGPLGTHIEDAVIGAIRQQARDLEQLRADLAAAVAENDELRAAMADHVSRSAYITRLTTGPDGATLSLSGDGPRVLAAAFVGMYRDCGAENYVELTLQDPANGERFAVTVHRVEGKTPNQLMREAEAERDTLRARLAAIETAPVVATVVAHADEGGMWPALDYEDEDLPPIGTDLIARPAKD